MRVNAIFECNWMCDPLRIPYWISGDVMKNSGEQHTSCGRRRTFAIAAISLLLADCAALDESKKLEKSDFILEREALWLNGDLSLPFSPQLKRARRDIEQPDELPTDVALPMTSSIDNRQALVEANGIEEPTRLKVGQMPRTRTELSPTEQSARSASLSVDLLSSLRAAQTNDSTFLLARTDYAIAQSGIPIARSALRPQITASAVAQYVELLNGDQDAYSQSQASLVASQPLINTLSTRTLAQAKRRAAIAETQLMFDQESLILRVTEGYFVILEAEAQLAFRQSDLEATQQQQNRIENLREVGSVSVTDVAEARAIADRASTALIDAQNTLDDARESFAEITGLSIESVYLDVDETLRLTPPVPFPIEHWLESAVSNNRGLLLARELRKIATEEVNVARAQRLPTVSFDVNATTIDSGTELTLSGAQVGAELGVVLPLFSGGRINAEIASALLQQRRATEEEQGVKQTTVRQTRSAYRNVLTAISRAESLTQTLVSTELAADAVSAGFDAGTRTSVELLNAQRDVFIARADLATARYDYLFGMLTLKRLTGRMDANDVLTLNKTLQ